MKTLATLLATFAIAASLSACDSTSPETITVRDTTIVYHNDRFAKANAVVHGIWKISTPTDTATATLFQDTTAVLATIQWKSGTTWNLTASKFTKDSLILSGDNNFLNMWAKFTDSANHKITKMNGTYLNARNPPTNGSIPTWTAVRTF